MSIISQFFPSSGGGGGNETPTGILIPADGIPVEILGFSGSGGGGTSAGGPSYQGYGGSGAVMHATNYFVQPGCTVPITIGAGGANAGCPCGQGSQGGTTSFNYPVLPISVIGGGGGAGLDSGIPFMRHGCPGGTGGGSTRHYSTIIQGESDAGDGFYFNKINEYSSSYYSSGCSSCACAWSAVTKVSDAEMETTPWGCRGGFPGRPGKNTCAPPGYLSSCGCGGGATENASCWPYMNPACTSPVTCRKDLNYKYYCSSISGTMTDYTGPGQWGQSTTNAGCAGGLIIKWATAFGASPPTGFPGGTDISPATPGYYTYCFASTGSIELP